MIARVTSAHPLRRLSIEAPYSHLFPTRRLEVQGGSKQIAPIVEPLPEIFADFAGMDRLPDLGTVLMLGTAKRHPEYTQLVGKPVVFRDPNEVEADGYIMSREQYGETFFYGALMSDIRDISPQD